MYIMCEIEYFNCEMFKFYLDGFCGNFLFVLIKRYRERLWFVLILNIVYNCIRKKL